MQMPVATVITIFTRASLKERIVTPVILRTGPGRTMNSVIYRINIVDTSLWAGIKKLNVPNQFKSAITFLVEKGINELGWTIKNKLAKHE